MFLLLQWLKTQVHRRSSILVSGRKHLAILFDNQYTGQMTQALIDINFVQLPDIQSFYNFNVCQATPLV